MDVLYFLNMTSAVGHKVVLIPDYLHSTFHIFEFSHVLLRECYLSRIISELLSAQNAKLTRFTRPKQNYAFLQKSAYKDFGEFSLLSAL